MERLVRFVIILIGIAALIAAIGFFLQLQIVTQIWPLASGRLSNIFISSILAAIGAPVLWIGLSGDLRAMVGGAINLMVTNAGFAGSMLRFYSQDHKVSLLVFAVASILTLILTISLAIYSLRFRFADTRRTPIPVRVSFGVFAAVLFVTALALIARRPNIFPWPLSGDNSVMYGWIFLGAMCYFLYGLVVPNWSNARGQLIGFLAYDVVLIAPFITHFRAVQPQMLTSLIIYTAVVSYSGLLALYYLFLYQATRRKGVLRAA